MRNKILGIIVIFIFIIFFIIVVNLFFNREPYSDYSNISYEKIELQKLFDDLDSNPFSAKETYKNKYIEICGEISAIDAGGACISLQVPNNRLTLDSILCKIQGEEQRDFVMLHQNGDMITVQGQIIDITNVLGYIVKSHTLIGE